MQQRSLVRGQNSALTDSQSTLILSVPGKQLEHEVDFSAVLLGQDGKVSTDGDFVFFNQPTHPSGALSRVDGSTFRIDLARVPAHITRIAFIATCEQGVGSFNQGYTFTVTSASEGIIFEGNSESRCEKSLIGLEIYRKESAWKLKVVDQGFAGGMAPLANHFGVEVDADAGSHVPPARDAAPESKAQPAPAPINLQKVTLEKRGETISLQKKSQGFGEIVVNLNWNQGTSKKGSGGLLGGLLGGGNGAIDLDLGCFYELEDGSKGVVQSLGKTFGNLQGAPWIQLDGDDRSGESVGGETLRINGEFWNRITRVMIIAFIYKGAPNWSETDGMVRLRAPDQPEIEIQMDATGAKEGFCVVAMLKNQNGALEVSKEVNYFAGHKKADEHYGFGMRWTAASK